MIFCVEDEANIRELVVYTLETTGFEARGFEEGTSFFEALAEELPELILLDIMLPGEDGMEILKKLKTSGRTKDIPVIMVTAKGAEYDKVMGLDAGADDYLTKPFSVEELLARLRVTRRRLQMMKSDALNQSAVFVNGDLRIDYAAGCVYLGEEELHLTPIEYKLLCLLAQNAGRVLTHTFIMENIWGSNWEKDIASLRVFMATLRRKLEKNPQSLQYIQTHVGVGYRMMKFEESSENKKGEY